MFDNGSRRNKQTLERTCHRCFLLSFGSFGQVASEEIFFKRPIRNKNFLWQPCLLMDQNYMGICYRGPSKDDSYQVSVHLAKRLQRRRFFQKSTNQKQEMPLAAMFVNGSELNEQSLQRTFQGCFLPSFGSFDKVASEEKIFQESTNQRQELPMVAMFVNGSGRNQQSLQRTCHRCFLPSFGSLVNRKQMCGKPGKGRHGTSHHAKAIYQI